MIYVVNINKQPLMPTQRGGRVRWLLKNNLAKVITSQPFTIQLLYDTEDKTQSLTLGIDPGRTNIGMTVVNEKGDCVYSAQVSTRNKEIPKLMMTRKQNRLKHRHLKRRCKRQRRAIAANTTVKGNVLERILPGCKEPIKCHFIKNKEAKFNNRVRPAGWLTPTANHLLQTHLNLVKLINKMLPVTSVVLEINQFAFMELDNKYIKPWMYNKGELYGFGSVEEAVNKQQDNHCLLCKQNIEHYHHIVPISKGGSNTLANRAGLCEKHHHLVHTDETWTAKLATKKAGINKKYGALSVLNQIIPYLVVELEAMYPMYCFATTGKLTYEFRLANSVPKDHYLDAYCIASSTLNGIKHIDTNIVPYQIRQFRRHDRQACHQESLNRNYYLDGKVVATNHHKALEQKSPSLDEYRAELIASGSDVAETISKLVIKEHHATYKDMSRIYPGAMLKSGTEYFILQGSEGKHNGLPSYYHGINGTKYKTNDCSKVLLNNGLVYI